MSASQQILREYLFSLGFKVDKKSEQDFTWSIIKGELATKGLLGAMQAAAKAAYELTAGFAKAMEELYYSSRKADTTMDRLQGIEFGARSIGMQAGQVTSALQSMAMQLRTNPGLMGLLKTFGVEVKGRTMDKVAEDLLTAISKRPFYIGSQYANLFGFSEDQYFMLTQSLPKLKQMEELRKSISDEMGFSADAAAKESIAFDDSLRRLEARLGVLKDVIANWLLGPITKVINFVDRDVRNAVLFVRGAKDSGSVKLPWQKDSWSGSTNLGSQFASGTVTSSDTLGMRNNNPGNIMHSVGGGEYAMNAYATPASGLQAMARQLLVYQARGINTIRKIINTYAPAGGKGNSAATVSGYIADVAAKTGWGADSLLDFRDPNVLARYMAAAVSHEQGGKTGALGAADYLAAARGAQPVVLQQSTTINVSGPDPARTSQMVASEQTRINDRMVAGVVRDFSGGAR